MENRKTILLVTVDCLRADHVGFMGYSRPTTPFLDDLAAESIVIPNAIVAGAPTYYSLPGVLASRYPLALGRDVLGLAPDETSLPSVLQENGYKTAAYSAANPYISRRFGYAAFETFQDFLQVEQPEPEDHTRSVTTPSWASRANQRLQKIRPALGPLAAAYDELYFQYCQWRTPAAKTLDDLRRFPAADVIVDHAAQWLASIGDAPAFLWLHLMDPHSPYYPKSEALAAMGESAIRPQRARYLNSYWQRSDLRAGRLNWHRQNIVRLYDASIRWVDMQLKRLVSTLQSLERWDQCVVALTADHGEEFLDHGGRFHPPSRLMEELIHVPLLLRVPGLAKTSVSRYPFSLIHLAPTLLDTVHVPVPSEFQGRSCWPQIKNSDDFDRPAISESVASCTNPFHPDHRMGPRVLCVRESRFKLVLHFDPIAEDLYDLEADPHEQSPLPASAQMPVRRHLLEIALAHVRESRERRNQRVRIRARLRDLRLEWGNPTHEIARVAG